MPIACRTVAALGLVCWLGSAVAAPLAPPPPPTYDVELRYVIRAGRAQRLIAFDQLERQLKAFGFQFADDEENDGLAADAERLHGTIASDKARRLLNVANVATALLTPAGWQRPEGAAARVPVNLTLAGPYPIRQQRLLAQQALERLRGIGFQEYLGFDDRNFTRLRGTIPVAELDTLLRDLRGQPAGWFAPEDPYESLTDPLRSVVPIRLIEVTPDPEGVAPAAEPPPPVAELPGTLSKLSPDLAAAGLADGDAAKMLRVQAIVDEAPADDDLRWQKALGNSVPGLVIEGRVGPVLTLSLPAGSLGALTEIPAVTAVRLPPAAATEAMVIEAAQVGSDPVAQSRVGQLHQLGRQGAGVRIVLVDSDFAGLPEGAGLLDLTAAQSTDIVPSPMPETAPGRGTLVAEAIRKAAPQATLTLVRIDPTAMYHLVAVTRFIHKNPVEPADLLARVRQLAVESEELAERLAVLLRRRTELLNAFDASDEGVQQRADLNKQIEALAQEEAAHLQRSERIRLLRRGLANLAGADMLVCPLVWNTGYPLDGGSPLSTFLHEAVTPPLPWIRVGGLKPTPKLLWFQAAGDTGRQAWSGLFQDNNGDGVLEFASPRAPLPPERWSEQINFLGLDTSSDVVADLPAGARLRVTVQWSEAHDPEVTFLPEDPYLLPLADLRPVLLRQRDPSGQQLPADDFEVSGRASARPVRLLRLGNLASYEQTLEVALPAAGRYALRVEGRVPTGLVPPEVAELAADQRSSELKLRLFVEFVDGQSRAQGRPVLVDFASDQGGVGVAGDAHGLVVIGAARPDGQPRTFSPGGGGPNIELLPRPHLLAYDAVSGTGGRTGGTGVATGFAAGEAASLLSGGVGPNFFLRWIGLPAGSVFVIPEPFLRRR